MNESYPTSLEDFRNSVILFNNYTFKVELDIISSCITWETYQLEIKLKEYEEASDSLQKIQDNLKNIQSNLEKAELQLAYIEQQLKTKDTLG